MVNLPEGMQSGDNEQQSPLDYRHHFHFLLFFAFLACAGAFCCSAVPSLALCLLLTVISLQAGLLSKASCAPFWCA